MGLNCCIFILLLIFSESQCGVTIERLSNDPITWISRLTLDGVKANDEKYAGEVIPVEAMIPDEKIKGCSLYVTAFDPHMQWHLVHHVLLTICSHKPDFVVPGTNLSSSKPSFPGQQPRCRDHKVLWGVGRFGKKSVLPEYTSVPLNRSQYIIYEVRIIYY